MKIVRMMIMALIVIIGLAVTAIYIVGDDSEELDLILLFFGGTATGLIGVIGTFLSSDKS